MKSLKNLLDPYAKFVVIGRSKGENHFYFLSNDDWPSRNIDTTHWVSNRVCARRFDSQPDAYDYIVKSLVKKFPTHEIKIVKERHEFIPMEEEFFVKGIVEAQKAAILDKLPVHERNFLKDN